MVLSFEDRKRIQTLRQQGLGARAIKVVYLQKAYYAEEDVHVDESTGLRSAMELKVGSGRPKSARSEANVAMVKVMICSKEDESGNRKSTRQIAGEMGSVLHTTEESRN